MKRRVNVNKKKTAKFAAGLFIVLVAGAMAYSINDAYSITAQFNIQIEVEPATVYALDHMYNNESIMVLAPFNFFSQDMIRFYLAKNGNSQIQTYQYPLLPTDTYTPTLQHHRINPRMQTIQSKIPLHLRTRRHLPLLQHHT